MKINDFDIVRKVGSLHMCILQSSRLIYASFRGIRMVMCTLRDHETVMMQEVNSFIPSGTSSGSLTGYIYTYPFMFNFSSKVNTRGRPTRDKKETGSP